MRKTLCPHCKVRRTRKGHDACIADLPDVRFACCGHGIAGIDPLTGDYFNGCYVFFDCGITLYGHAAHAAMTALGGNPPPIPARAQRRSRFILTGRSWPTDDEIKLLNELMHR